MCMNHVDFKLKKRNGKWIGEGYRVVLESRFPGNGRIEKKMEIGKWLEANPRSLAGKLDGPGEDDYPKGFHTFLNQEDAQLYAADWYGEDGANFEPYEIRRVEFMDVLAFGMNRLNDNEDGLCIISKYIKICEVV